MLYEKIQEKENYLHDLSKLEDDMDKLNGDYGEKDAMCIYCKSKEYNSQVGIVHTKQCAIQQIRDLIKEK